MNPEIFKNKINVDNNNYIYRGGINNDSISSRDIPTNYPVKVYIKTYAKEYNTIVTNRTRNYLITIDKRVIYIDDIISIKVQ